MSEQITNISVRALWRRGLLLVPVLATCVGLWYVARWCLGNTMAEWASDASVAQAAARFAPADPQAHYSLARLAERSFEPSELPGAVAEYERAAALSPHDYRLWLELGRVRGLAGDDAGSEQALRRATALAPGYPTPHWYLGNLLLRTNRAAAAFPELLRASAADPVKYRGQVFDLAWYVYEGDVPALLSALGDTPEMRAGLTQYLTGRQRFDDALKLWAVLPQTQQQQARAVGDKLVQALLTARRYRDALAVQRSFDTTTGPDFERLLNGGFEAAVGPPGQTWYDWQVTPVAQVQINLDERMYHAGARSLRLVFGATGQFDFHHVQQLVVVAPQTRYRLNYFVRTEDLKSSSTILTEVAEAADPTRVLGATAPLANGTHEWQPAALDFTTTAQTQAVVVRLNRAPCGAPLCPLFGKVWYDDFNLQRLDGGGRAAHERPAAHGDDAPTR